MGILISFIAVFLPIVFMLFLHMFGLPKVIVVLGGLMGDGIVIYGSFFSGLDMGGKIFTVMVMSMTLVLFYVIADNKDSMGMS